MITLRLLKRTRGNWNEMEVTKRTGGNWNEMDITVMK